MDMDDPWGSPWADEIQPPRPVKTLPGNDENGDRSRPRDFVQISSLALQDQTNSPWSGTDTDIPADDGDIGFGEWASVPSKPGASPEGPNNGWVGGLEDKNDRALNREQENGFATGWNNTSTVLEAPVVRLGSGFLSGTTNITREPSPDPWASIPETDAKGDQSSGPAEVLGHYNHTNGLTSIQHAKEGEDINQSLEHHGLKLPLDAGITATVPTTHNESKEDEPGAEVEVDNLEGSSDLTVRPKTPSSPQYIGHTPSIPSSSPSEQSHHDENLSESPRTSMEDESNPSQMPRKSSSKVQELVEHFDTLAKDEATDLASGRTSVTEVQMKNDDEPEGLEHEEDDEDDFGDFEDGHSEINESTTEAKEYEITTPDPASNTTEEIAGVRTQDMPSPISPQKKDLGPIEFIPDTSLVGELYPNTKESSPVERSPIPDLIPHNSFTSAEERKMWYRISRYGPMRQHNAGDDENYVRVNWTGSQARAESLKIVARWIEEDRTSGRVVLGGGSKAGSIFGWNDTKSKPASIATAFAAKKAKDTRITTAEPISEIPREWPKDLAKNRSTSKGHSSPKARRRSSAKSIQSPELTRPEKQLPVAAFEWNTNANSDTAQKQPSRRLSSTHRTSGSTSSIVSPINSPSPSTQSPSSRSLPPSSSNSSKPVVRGKQNLSPVVKLPTILSPSIPQPSSEIRVSAPVLEPASTNDDEWGEMISSPVTAASPAIPQLKSLHHKKSQSLGGWITPRNQELTSTQYQTPSVPYERSHRPTLSFDDILKPETRSSQNTNVTSRYNPSHNVIQGSVVHSTKATVTAPLEANADPWASADFSFFEGASAPPVPPKNSPSPVSRVAPLPNASYPRASPVASASILSRKPKDEIEQDKIVQTIVKGLPDLSYMFKR